jgi:hypothetical protein
MLLCLFFTVPLIAAGPAYPVRVSSNHRYLVDQKGTPFLIQGDAGWSIIVGLPTEQQVKQYLANRSKKGFNTIVVNLIEHKFCKNPPRNADGEAPFLTPGDFTTPNEKYFAHADWVIRRAADYGIQVLLAPFYLGYEGTDEGWYQEVLANGPERCLKWGMYLGKRYRDFDNIIWVVGNDHNPGPAREDVDMAVVGIKVNDPRHLITAQCAPENSAVDQYGDSTWLDLNSTYTYQLVHDSLLRDFNRKPVIPYFLIESTYEGEHNASQVQIRRQAYWADLSGSTGQVFGNKPIWLFDPGWEEAMDGPGSQAMAYLNELFHSRPWYKLVPDQAHRVVTGGLGELTGLDYVAAAFAEDQTNVMAYLPTSRTVTVDMTKITGDSATGWWFNPRDGTATRIGDFATKGSRQFTPPAPGDWVLVIDEATLGLPAPGSKRLTDMN